MENSANLTSLPNEILFKIFAKAGNHKSLSLVCRRFYELTTKLNENNVKLVMGFDHMVSHENIQKVP
jgi:hypothetical protein